MPNINDQPTNVLTHILTTATTHDDLLAHVAICARVHPEWRRAVMGSAAYGLGIVGRSADKGATETAATEALRALNIGGLSRRAKELGIGEEMLEALQDDDEPKQALIRWLAPRDPGATAAEERSRVLRELSSALRQAKEEGKLELIDDGIGDAGARALDAAVRALPSPLALTEFSAFCQLSQAGIATVAGMMRSGRLGTQLRELDVSGNPLGDAGTETLASALPPTLETFAFASVGCGDAGMAAVARALSGTAVRMIVCSDNPVGTKGWAALGAALPQERGAALGLRQELSDETSPEMIEASEREMGVNVAEEFCCLQGELGTAGMTALAAGLAESRLAMLILTGCRDVDDAGYRAVAAALPRSKLKGLSFEQSPGHFISAEARAALQTAAAQIPNLDLIFEEADDHEAASDSGSEEEY